MKNEDAMGMLESALYCVHKSRLDISRSKHQCVVDEIRFDIFGNIITLFPSAF